MDLQGVEFRNAGAIDAERASSGDVTTYTAYERFANPDGLPLNKYGRGPFARLIVGPLPKRPGVYVIEGAGQALYVGLAVNVAERWGRRGYSVIDPRNCYRGGQSTNCRLNNFILGALMAGQSLRLWIHECSDPRAIETQLIQALRPPWNVHGV